MADIDTMSLRERTAGLMRGNRANLQLGYTARNAAVAALRYERGPDVNIVSTEESELRELFAYADGFADGMADALERFPREQPAMALTFGWEHAEYERHFKVEDYGDERLPLGHAYLDGLEDGRKEFAPSLYPALTRKPKPDYIQRFPERANG